MSKIMIVTGAATGIGLACAMRLAKKYQIVGTWLNTAMPQEIGEEGTINPFQCDVSNYEDCLKLAKHAASLGEIYGFVHCAAINPTPAPSVEEMEPEFWKRILDVNLTSSFYLAKAVIPFTANGGAYVFVSSTAGRNGFSLAGGTPGHAKTAYATSKAGIIAFTKGLAKELAPRNIRVNCMAAGPIDTRMLPNREETAKRVPLGRTGLPEECAAAVEFLLENATYTTGCTLDVCGGQYMN